MSTIMDQLESDHVNVARLLDVLDAQLATLDDERATDFQLMHDVMVYMTRYPDRFHHPMEDLVFERMCARDADALDVVRRLSREHGALAEKGARLVALLSRVVDGAMVERGELRASGRDYVLFLRSHMAVEDDEAFPRARQVLDAGDWSAVRTGMEMRSDPVFGPVVDEDLRSLYDYIQRQRA